MGPNKTALLPLYYRVREDIREKINNGVWKVGERIDSEIELAKKYNISRMTLRQAIGELVNEGLLIREKGKGTFVCEPKVKQKDIMSFTEMAKKNNMQVKTNVLEFSKIKPLKYFHDLLPFEYIFKIYRARLVNNTVAAIELVFLPCEYCPDIKKTDLEGSLYKILNENGYFVNHCEDSIEAVLSDEYLKRLFKVKENIPLLKVNSKNYDSDNKLIFIEESTYRSDKYVMEANIFKKEGIIK